MMMLILIPPNLQISSIGALNRNQLAVLLRFLSDLDFSLLLDFEEAVDVHVFQDAVG